MNGKREYLAVLPPVDWKHGPVKGMGSRVVMPDGTPIPGVRSIDVSVSKDGEWEVTLICVLQPPLPSELPPCDQSIDVTEINSDANRQARGREGGAGE